MAELIHEIWHDEDSQSYEMGPASQRGDEVRKFTAPDAVKVHTFKAHSDYEAAQKNYNWHGWGKYKPEPGWPEHFFTDEEAGEQRRYIAIRNAT